MANCIRKVVLILIITMCASAIKAEAVQSTPSCSELNATFGFDKNEVIELSVKQKQQIQKIIKSTIKEFCQLIPELDNNIHFTVLVIQRDLSMVRGVTGRADKPTEIEISLSSSYTGGIDSAIHDGLKSTLFHELHHTVRGWTIYNNKFGPGIDIAIINEGLADVFAEIQSEHPHNYYPNNVDYDAWTKEILALPKTANYGEWMFSHPDGREAIGYRTGAYVVKKAMKNSGLDILALSRMSVDELYKLAGYSRISKSN